MIQPEFNGVVNFQILCSVQVRFISLSLPSTNRCSVQFMDYLNCRGRGKDCVCDRTFYFVQEDSRWRETASCGWSGGRCYELVRGCFLNVISSVDLGGSFAFGRLQVGRAQK